MNRRCSHCGESIGLPDGPLSANPLTAQLLDLITLMPDSQTQEILDYIESLRAARRLRTMDLDER